jgi:hypothetical protein
VTYALLKLLVLRKTRDVLQIATCNGKVQRVLCKNSDHDKLCFRLTSGDDSALLHSCKCTDLYMPPNSALCGCCYYNLPRLLLLLQLAASKAVRLGLHDIVESARSIPLLAPRMITQNMVTQKTQRGTGEHKAVGLCAGVVDIGATQCAPRAVAIGIDLCTTHVQLTFARAPPHIKICEATHLNI